jgi:hypothetical protein
MDSRMSLWGGNVREKCRENTREVCEAQDVDFTGSTSHHKLKTSSSIIMQVKHTILNNKQFYPKAYLCNCPNLYTVTSNACLWYHLFLSERRKDRSDRC